MYEINLFSVYMYLRRNTNKTVLVLSTNLSILMFNCIFFLNLKQIHDSLYV